MVTKLLGKLIQSSRTKVLVYGFLVIILLGAFVLSLPISSKEGTATRFIDALFTSTTSVCITGLTVVDTYAHWSTFGQIVILCLIQIGGLSFVAFAILFSMIIGRTISLKERLLVVDYFNKNDINGVVRLTKHMFAGTLLFELIGASLLAVRFVPYFGIKRGVFSSVFHSVSAFCNAGIDIMAVSSSFGGFSDYSADLLVIFTFVALITIGGLGFFVWEDVISSKKRFKFRLHTKIVLLMTGIMTLLGFFCMIMLEFNNPESLGGLTLKEKICSSLFQVVSYRTAGFSMINVEGMTVANKFISMLFMFIGGAPGSTAGGIKTTTFVVLLATLFAAVEGRKEVTILGRRLKSSVIVRTVAILTISLAICCIGVICLAIFEPQFDLMDIFYEVVSALGTVGLSLGITPKLSDHSKIVIVLLMFYGRVGALSTVIALAARKSKRNSGFSCPDGEITVG